MRTKNEQIGFRLPLSLKRDLSEVANREGRTLSQMCEIFVSLGLEAYNKEGHRYLAWIIRDFAGEKRKDALKGA
jgi:predicted DNA-binding protein